MSTFDHREEAFEDAYAHDQELLFKARAHRNRTLASWAAGVMDKPGAAAAAYVDLILNMAVCGETDEAVYQRIRQDLHAAGHPLDDRQIHAQMERLMREAVEAVHTA
jgi:hypothetical protein